MELISEVESVAFCLFSLLAVTSQKKLTDLNDLFIFIPEALRTHRAFLYGQDFH